MRIYRYATDVLEELYHVPSGLFYSEYAIVDNELQNDISKDWNYKKGVIACTGILYKNRISIYVAESANDEDFKREVSRDLDALSKFATLYAYNKNMEEGNFNGNLNIQLVINEIKPFRGKDTSKNKLFYVLIHKRLVPGFEIDDPVLGDGKLCPIFYQRYLQNHNDVYLKDIVKHNLSCLLKECLILKNRSFFRMNYEIDKYGFVLGDINAV